MSFVLDARIKHITLAFIDGKTGNAIDTRRVGNESHLPHHFPIERAKNDLQF